MRRPRRRFAAPFVLTVACSGGGGTPEPQPPKSDFLRTWYVSGRGGDQCMASENLECPPRVMCNPPPPIALACPTPLEPGQPGVRIVEVSAGSCAIAALDCDKKDCATQATPCPEYPKAPAPATP